MSARYRHDQRRRVIARVAAGQEDRVESRQVGKRIASSD